METIHAKTCFSETNQQKESGPYEENTQAGSVVSLTKRDAGSQRVDQPSSCLAHYPLRKGCSSHAFAMVRIDALPRAEGNKSLPHPLISALLTRRLQNAAAPGDLTKTNPSPATPH
jgi:hypothetical protein